jgi:tRNA-Thr(GGU) m(6)t(6)A37 methyltransferase TsaA
MATAYGKDVSSAQEGVMNEASYSLRAVGSVESPLTDRDLAPRQGDEGAPPAWLVLDPGMRAAIDGLAVGADVIVLTWLDRARRDVLRVRPRGDQHRPEQGVFSTRSPDRPNPIGLHQVRIVAIDGTRIAVLNLEALDRTPILDIKPVLGPVDRR